jgi:cyclopropane-fatty-acyl-phospholipid synthase
MALSTRDAQQTSAPRDEIEIYVEGEPGSAAHSLAPLLRTALGDRPPVRIELWDGSTAGPLNAPGALRVRSPDALRRLLWAPGELGLARAFVAGDLEVDGDIFDVLDALRLAADVDDPRFALRLAPRALAAARATGALGPPLPPPAEEARPHGRRHSRRRDAEVVRHHYDVGNEFYELVLGPSMTYSCARFGDRSTTLEEAQAAKHELVARKLGLAERPGARLLDVGCGWGSMAIHAAQHHAATVVGITISPQQATLARERVAAAGVADRVEIRVQDYRDLDDAPFDAISSIGMFEHVGAAKTAEYFGVLRRMLRDEGRLLNHAISRVGSSRMRGRTFIGRYVFPDGELMDVGQVTLAMESAGFEVRDVESLREHYGRTLRAWVANLEARWDDAVGLVGARRARVWRLYMAGSALGFEAGRIGVHQVLGVLPGADGSSGMPRTRDAWRVAT